MKYELTGCYSKDEEFGLCKNCEYVADKKKCEAWRIIYDSTQLYKQTNGGDEDE